MDYNPDVTTKEWSRLKAWLEAELDIAYQKLAGDMEESKTQHLRGQIAFIKRLLLSDKGRYETRFTHESNYE